ncbi:hypothetical protein HBN54_004445 [Hymenobacter sp. 1B]|uniref:Uncharacterized protein n=1 Tax=Hymenobacter artigasi TaxID=2719616 RepID=A0ABX1HRA4_9BACT|nr:hypothetical protein [Hymenobacter artigasi]
MPNVNACVRSEPVLAEGHRQHMGEVALPAQLLRCPRHKRGHLCQHRCSLLQSPLPHHAAASTAASVSLTAHYCPRAQTRRSAEFRYSTPPGPAIFLTSVLVKTMHRLKRKSGHAPSGITSWPGTSKPTKPGLASPPRWNRVRGRSHFAAGPGGYRVPPISGALAVIIWGSQHKVRHPATGLVQHINSQHSLTNLLYG